jgi:hypothetical protein
MDRDVVKAEFLSREEPRVTRDDHAFCVDYDGLSPAELLDAPGDLR